MLTNLRRLVGGTVLGPGDPGFDQARTGWNTGIDQRVAAVVHARDVADLAATVRYARHQGLAVSVQPRGHGASPALNGTLLVRPDGLTGITVDPDRRIARVEAGVRWSQLLPEVGRHGLLALAGSSSDPSVVGYTLGGGLSWFSRRYGLAADAVRAFDILDAEGEPARVTADSDPELFWALRGGGGDYALVTALEMDLFPAPQLSGGSILWPRSRAPEVLAAYQRVVASAPDELSVWFTLLNLPTGQSLAAVQVTYLGDVATLRSLMAPLLAVGGAMVEALRPLPFAELDSVAAEPADPMPVTEFSLLLPDLTDVAAKTLLEVAGPPWISVQLRHLGGALTTIPEQFAFCAVGVPPVPSLAAMEPFSSGRKLFNFLAAGEPASLAFSPDEVAQLLSLKKARDPHSVFRTNRPL